MANASLPKAWHTKINGLVMVGIIRFYAHKNGAFHLIDVEASSIDVARQKLAAQGYTFDLVEGGDAYWIEHIETV